MPNDDKLSIDNSHALPAEEVLRKLQAKPEGLSGAEAASRLDAVAGPNRLPAPPKEGLLKRFFKHSQDLLIYILIAAAAATAVLTNHSHSIVAGGFPEMS